MRTPECDHEIGRKLYVEFANVEDDVNVIEELLLIPKIWGVK